MEKEDVVKTQKGSYLAGIIGAIIGGAIASIPWILTYVYGNMMFSILAALIAAGEFYGYKIAKGKMDKKLTTIIMVVAIIIVAIVTLVVIPALLIQKQGLNPSLVNIEKMYSNKEFFTAIIKDFIVAIVFTILGASIITTNIKKQLENNDGQDIKLDLNNNEQTNKIKKEAIELVKPIFVKYEAVNKEKAMIKEEVLAEIEDSKAKQKFQYLKQLGIIKKYKGKYYYSEDGENKKNKVRKISVLGIISIILIIIAIILIGIGTISDTIKKYSKATYQDSNISFKIGEDWTNIKSNYTSEWNFYKYISTFPVSNSTTNNVTVSNSTQDYSTYPAIISLYYDTVDTESIKTIEDIKSNLETTFEKTEDKPDILNIDIEKTSNNYDMAKVEMEYHSKPEEVAYYYYIFKDGKLACITVYSYSLQDKQEIEQEGNEIANSFSWLQ